MHRKKERLQKLVTIGLMLLAGGCAVTPPNSPPPSVAPARIPQLSP